MRDNKQIIKLSIAIFLLTVIGGIFVWSLDEAKDKALLHTIQVKLDQTTYQLNAAKKSLEANRVANERENTKLLGENKILENKVIKLEIALNQHRRNEIKLTNKYEKVYHNVVTSNDINEQLLILNKLLDSNYTYYKQYRFVPNKEQPIN